LSYRRGKRKGRAHFPKFVPFLSTRTSLGIAALGKPGSSEFVDPRLHG